MVVKQFQLCKYMEGGVERKPRPQIFHLLSCVFIIWAHSLYPVNQHTVTHSCLPDFWQSKVHNCPLQLKSAGAQLVWVGRRSARRSQDVSLALLYTAFLTGAVSPSWPQLMLENSPCSPHPQCPSSRTDKTTCLYSPRDGSSFLASLMVLHHPIYSMKYSNPYIHNYKFSVSNSWHGFCFLDWTLTDKYSYYPWVTQRTLTYQTLTLQ